MSSLFFIPRSMPRGDAPDELRKQWIDVPIPAISIREGYPGARFEGSWSGGEFDIPAGSKMVETNGELALHALGVFGRDGAAKLWRDRMNLKAGMIRN